MLEISEIFKTKTKGIYISVISSSKLGVWVKNSETTPQVYWNWITKQISVRW